MPTIRLADTDLDIASCFPVMQQLRPQLDAGGFVARVRRMHGEGFYFRERMHISSYHFALKLAEPPA
jgi:hypothetical protein